MYVFMFVTLSILLSILIKLAREIAGDLEYIIMLLFIPTSPRDWWSRVAASINFRIDLNFYIKQLNKFLIISLPNLMLEIFHIKNGTKLALNELVSFRVPLWTDCAWNWMKVLIYFAYE